MDKILAVHELEGRGDLGDHALGVRLAQRALAHVGRQIAEGRHLLSEVEITFALEGHVVRVEGRRVRTQVVAVVELAEELAPAGAVLAHRLQHHFGPRTTVLRQQHFGEPALAQCLQDVVLFIHVHLRQSIPHLILMVIDQIWTNFDVKEPIFD